MPENAAAEGGYGLSASEAFGGQVGTGNVSASEVGGTFGGFGPDFGGGADDPSQSGQFGMGTPTPGNAVSNAQALATRAENLAQAAAANRAAAAAASGMRGKAASNLGLGTGVAVAQAQNAINAAMNQKGTVTGQDVAAISAATGLAPGFVNGLAQEAAVNAAVNAAANANAATKGSGLGIGSMMDESINPTVSTTTGMVSVDENGNIVSYGIDTPAAPTAPGLTTAEEVMSLDQIDVTAPNVTEQMISEDLMSLAPTATAPTATAPTAIAPTTTAPTQTAPTTAYSEKGLLGRIAQDISMGLTNPFASRETQTESLLGRGYSQADIDAYFDRTDATIARDAEAQLNAPGGRDDYLTASERLMSGDQGPSSSYPYYLTSYY